jgi:hypothetical protein
MNVMQMLVTLGHVPGVPAAGHMAGGYWHPGAARNCKSCAHANHQGEGDSQ